MLNFCVQHNIKPIVEHFKFNDINNAIDKVRSNEVRFRAVLSW